jgi:hypothetical protein
VGEVSDVIERRFRTSGIPRLRVENVAGETTIRGGADEVVVRVYKHAHADSPERARRLLDNVDVEIEQDGDEIRVSQRAFLVDRGFIGVFRERRAVIDYEIAVPSEAEVSVRSASGEIRVTGVQGPLELQSVSGDVDIEDVRGALRVRTVSGDCEARVCAGALEANSVSGDLSFERCSFPSANVRTVSGDFRAAAELASGGPYAVTTVSGDVALATPSPCEVRFQTASGDVSAGEGFDVQRTSRREFIVRHGPPDAPVVAVRTVSGDLQLEHRDIDAPAMPVVALDAALTEKRDRKAEAIEVLERLARGEMDVEEAARRLDAGR